MKCSQTSVLQLEKSGSLLRRRFMLDLVCFLILFALASSGRQADRAFLEFLDGNWVCLGLFSPSVQLDLFS